MKQRLFSFVGFFGLWRWYAAVFKKSKQKKSAGRWIFGRAACLGTDTFALLNTGMPLINIQKGRVDYLLSVQKDPAAKADMATAAKYILRDDIKDLILQQELADLPFKHAPAYIYLDSYAELTDQLFVQKNGRSSFCANYSDVDKSFTNEFVCEGLLPLDDLAAYYEDFFSLLRKKFGNVPIIFIHFPSKLDKREVFKKRSEQIKNAIETVGKNFLPFDSYEVPDSIVAVAEDSADEFPYHYNQATYQYLKQIIHQKYFQQ